MAGLEPARAFYGPTDFKSVASAISPHRLLQLRNNKGKSFILNRGAKALFQTRRQKHLLLRLNLAID